MEERGREWEEVERETGGRDAEGGGGGGREGERVRGVRERELGGEGEREGGDCVLPSSSTSGVPVPSTLCWFCAQSLNPKPYTHTIHILVPSPNGCAA